MTCNVFGGMLNLTQFKLTIPMCCRYSLKRPLVAYQTHHSR